MTEFDKGWNSLGSQQSAEAQRGQDARFAYEDKLIAERNDRRQKEYDDAVDREYKFAKEMWKSPLPSSTEQTIPGYSPTPATFRETVKRIAIVGCFGGLAYAYFILNLWSLEHLAPWALKGAVFGAIFGTAIYLVFLVLKLVVKILEWAFIAVLWASGIAIAIYLLSTLA